MKQNQATSYYPVVEIEGCTFEESTYVRGNKRWKASDLYALANKLKLKPFDYPLAAFDQTNKPFRMECMDDFIFQCNRVKNCDPHKPIMFDDLGQIADGYHRICKAILLGWTSIKAYRLPYMPDNYKEEK